MKPPMRLDSRGHSLTRFIERWWPFSPEEKRLRAHGKQMAARNLRAEELRSAIHSRAYHVEDVPDEHQSIWAFTVCGGPNRGRTALMVVAQDGTVRTVLPPEARRPPSRRPVKPRRSR